jgi:small subunit ribosomal protein S4
MGDPKKKRKQFQKPRKSFQKERIEKERDLKKIYGLKNKRELFRAETIVRGKRAIARKLLALTLETRLKREKELLDSLKRIGVLQGNPTLEDVLVLTSEAMLERRLQTIVWRKGLANTPKQARQFIVHGHISVNGKKLDKPSYLVLADEEKTINWYGPEMVFEEKKAPVRKGKAKAEEAQAELKKEFEEAKPEEKEVEKREQ